MKLLNNAVTFFLWASFIVWKLYLYAPPIERYVQSLTSCVVCIGR